MPIMDQYVNLLLSVHYFPSEDTAMLRFFQPENSPYQIISRNGPDMTAVKVYSVFISNTN